MGKPLLKLTENRKWCSMKTGGMQRQDGCPAARCPLLICWWVGKVPCKTENSATTRKKSWRPKPASGHPPTSPSLGSFPSGEGTCTCVTMASKGETSFWAPLQEAGTSLHSRFWGWQVATQPQHSHSIPVPPQPHPAVPYSVPSQPGLPQSAGCCHPALTLCPTSPPSFVT